MKKIINYASLLLLFCLPAMAQNTASASGNWDDCATWGNPTATGIMQNATDTKTINTGINVTQNVAWSTKTVDFGTGNGSISFADNTKSIDFVTDGGNDKACGPVITALTCASAVKTGTLTMGTVASNVSVKVPYTGGNGLAYPAGTGIASTGVTGLTATLAAGTLTSSTGDLTFSITGTPGGTGTTATFAVTFGGQSCSFSVAVAAGPAIITGPVTGGSRSVMGTYLPSKNTGYMYGFDGLPIQCLRNTTTTVTYGANNGGSYPAKTMSPGYGLTMSTPGGTLNPAGGTITITASGVAVAATQIITASWSVDVPFNFTVAGKDIPFSVKIGVSAGGIAANWCPEH